VVWVVALQEKKEKLQVKILLANNVSSAFKIEAVILPKTFVPIYKTKR
jgi:hypothetical protein